ncbi:MAG: HAD family phosphatase [Syntrophales bacterium]|jgi:HAD superfamily hydrolase (TIGR01509 family)|nr:HAD family phosphatase [Syntrophales bacterium]
MIRAIFWDNDGVLVDTEKLYFQATRELLQKAGVELTEALFRRISLQEGRSAFDLALEKGVSQKQIDRLHEERNRRYTELVEEGVRILDGVEETLAKLSGRVLQAIVTSSRRAHFDAIHAGTGLRSHFDFILTREDYLLSKPDPEPYRLAVTRSGFRPEECLVVEDSERGLRAAFAAGIRCIVVPNDLTRGGAFAGAWRVLPSCREIPGEIERINGKRV